MPPKSKLSKSRTAKSPFAVVKKTGSDQAAGEGDALPWPGISFKKGLSVDCILQDQIYVIDNLLTRAECEKWVTFGETLALEAPKPPGKDEAERTNYRFQTYAPALAASLSAILLPLLSHTPALTTPHPPAGLYPKIRIYDYPRGTFFGPHYDSSTVDPLTGLTSRWTLLIYLTDAPEVGGGETVFWTREPNAKGRNGQSLDVPLKAGRALLHRHGEGCLLHEGKEVARGHKWVLRSDVMYDLR